MARTRGLSTMLTAALAVVAHVVFLLAPAACSCAPAPLAAKAKTAPAHACCCKPGDAPMPCHSKGESPASDPGKDAPSPGCAASHASCQAEPPVAVAPADTHGLAHAETIAPVIAEIVEPPVPAAPAFRERDDGQSRGAPIGLIIARSTVLLI